MWEFLARRVGQSLLLLFLVSVLSFALIHAAPGGPISMMEAPNVSQAALEQQMKNLGLDQPIHIQYIKWLGRMVTGDFGNTFGWKMPVANQLWPALKNTLILMSVAFVIEKLISIPWGIMISTRPYGISDNLAAIIGYIGFALPTFWFGMLLQMLFASKLGWLPLSDMRTIGAPASTLDLARHMVLPVTALTVGSLAGYLKYCRSSMMEVLSQDYIRTARSKGVAERKVIFKHGLRNALIPIITLLGLELPSLVGGAALTERVFNWPGMGRLFIEWANGREYNGLMAIVLISSTVVILGNLLADILYAVVDPRVRLTGKGA